MEIEQKSEEPILFCNLKRHTVTACSSCTDAKTYRNQEISSSIYSIFDASKFFLCLWCFVLLILQGYRFSGFRRIENLKYWTGFVSKLKISHFHEVFDDITRVAVSIFCFCSLEMVNVTRKTFFRADIHVSDESKD